MLNEQQKLLYNITKNRVNNFYLNMKDHLSIDDYTKMNEYTSNIYKLEQQYIKQYGELPIWNSIDDVMNTYDELNNLLKDGNKMIIDYNNKLDTSIKYEPLIFHLFVIDNSLTLKIESQDNRLRGKHIAVVRYQKDDNKYNQIDISSASCCEIAYHDFYLLGEEKYDNDVYSFNFKDTEEVLTYIKDLLEIFKNINIFDTFIYIHNVNTNGLTTQKYFNGEKVHDKD